MYEIYCRIDHEKAFCISILYDAKSTLEANITNIKQKINSGCIYQSQKFRPVSYLDLQAEDIVARCNLPQ